MKQLFAALALTFAFANASEATTISPYGQLAYTMTNFEMGQGSVFGALPNSAEIYVNRREKTLTIISSSRISCPAGAYCIAMVPAPVIRTLPITYTGSPFCGGTLIRAEYNRLPVDGGALMVQLFDSTHNICGDTQGRLPVSVLIEERSARSTKTVQSKMFGIVAR